MVRPDKLSWLDRLKWACCEPHEGGYETDESEEGTHKFQSTLKNNSSRSRDVMSPTASPSHHDSLANHHVQHNYNHSSQAGWPTPVMDPAMLEEKATDWEGFSSPFTSRTVASPYLDSLAIARHVEGEVSAGNIAVCLQRMTMGHGLLLLCAEI